MNRGAFVVIVRGEFVLLVRSLTSKAFKNHWGLPGDVVEAGESPQDGAKREALEEAGIVCGVGSIITEFDNTQENICISIHKATYVRGQIVIQADEIAEAKWVRLQDAVTMPLAYNTLDVLLLVLQNDD